MRHYHIPHRKRPPVVDVPEPPKTPFIKQIERAFYAMLKSADDTEEALQDFTAGPRRERWDD